MALTIENGTGVDGANSYADLVAVRGHAIQRGIALNADDAKLEPMVHKAMDYLDGKGLGLLTLSWPLDNDVLCGSDVTSDQALTRLSRAIAQLCIEQSRGVDLAPTRTGAFVTEDTVGPLTTKYSASHGGGPGNEPDMLIVSDLLGPLLDVCGQGSLFTTVRV